MRTSEQLNELAAALSAAQGAMTFASKEAKSHHGKYAKLGNVWEAIRPHLSANGLSIIQSPSLVDGRVFLTTRILHKSGQWVESELNMRPVRDDAHSVGSAITYLRRYSLSPIIGSVDDEDDDGNAAMGKNKDTGKPETGEHEEKIFGNEPKKINPPKSPIPGGPLDLKMIFDGHTEQVAVVVEAIRSVGGSKERVSMLCKSFLNRKLTMDKVMSELRMIEQNEEIPF